MRRDHPEPIEVSLERLNGGPFVKIPDPDGLVFADGQDKVLVRMEETGRSILEMAATGIDFPCLRVCYVSDGILILLYYLHSPLILHSLTSLSSPAETINGRVGWKDTQFTPLSWPSSTNLTTASVFPNMSAWFALARAI